MASLLNLARPYLIAALAVGIATPLAAQSLAGTEWIPTDIADNTANGAGDVFIRLEQDSVFVGSGGCNSFRGRFVTNGDAILFGPAASTMMLCEDAILATETEILQGIGAARTFTQDGTDLELSDAQGTVIMRLQQREPD